MENVTKPRSAKRETITSLQDIEVEVVYAEPSKEAERILDAVIFRICEFGRNKRAINNSQLLSPQSSCK